MPHFNIVRVRQMSMIYLPQPAVRLTRPVKNHPSAFSHVILNHPVFLAPKAADHLLLGFDLPLVFALGALLPLAGFAVFGLLVTLAVLLFGFEPPLLRIF